jgi:hypothetical protein
LTKEDDGTTTLAGEVTDQAELHDSLMKVRDLGVALISVQDGVLSHFPGSLEPSNPSAPECLSPHR